MDVRHNKRLEQLCKKKRFFKCFSVSHELLSKRYDEYVNFHIIFVFTIDFQGALTITL